LTGKDGLGWINFRGFRGLAAGDYSPEKAALCHWPYFSAIWKSSRVGVVQARSALGGG